MTPKDIIDVYNKYGSGQIFKIDDSKISTSKGDIPVSYVPFTCINLHGKRTRVNLKFSKQVLCSTPKIPFGTTESNARDLRITFKKLSKDDLEGTDYNDIQKDVLIKSNNEFITALEIIDKELKLLVNEMIESDNEKIILGKNKEFISFKQSDRNASKEEKEEDSKRPKDAKKLNKDKKVLLENPLYRIKIPIDKDTRTLKKNIKMAGKNDLVPFIYDLRKTTRENPHVPARVKSGGKYVDLNVTNAKNFITYMSLVIGVFELNTLCISQQGISIMNKIKELYVNPHRVIKSNVISNEEYDDISSLVTSGYDDNINETDIQDEKKNKVTKNKKSNNSDDEPTLSDHSEIDSDDEPKSADEIESDDDKESEEEEQTNKNKKNNKNKK